MDLENCRKRKRKESFSSPSLSAHMAFLSRGPLALPPLSFLGQPSRARQPRQPSSRASPASRQATAAPPFRAQPLTAWPRCQSCPFPPASTPGQPQPPPNCARSSRIVGASPAPRPLFKRSRAPTCLSLSLPALISPSLPHRRPQQTPPRGLRAPPSASARNSITEPPLLRFSPR